jgi:type IV secretory pathway VirJ component
VKPFLLPAALLLLLGACSTMTAPGELPLVEMPAAATLAGTGAGADADTFVVFLSGDGGWRPLDVNVSKRLAAAGLPVVGFLSSDYLRTRRTPEQAAADLARVVREYSAKWNRPRVLLVGFSRGADILPFMAARLPQEVRARVALIALLGAEPEIDFKYHPSWIPFYHPHEPQFPVEPEVEKLRGTKVLCIRGNTEADSLCRLLEPSLAEAVAIAGGHHFGGHYEQVAKAILSASAAARSN